jgi:hypothetical protein
MLVVSYDEHGGFFDHFPPPTIRTESRDGSYPAFDSLGVRVPGFVVSPFVSKRSVYSGVLDHTSVLKMLGDKFGGGSYSADVDARAVRSLTEALDLDAPRQEIPRLEEAPPPQEETATAFRAAWARAVATPGSRAEEKYPHIALQKLVRPDATVRKAAMMAVKAAAAAAVSPPVRPSVKKATKRAKARVTKAPKKSTKKAVKKPAPRTKAARKTSKRKK